MARQFVAVVPEGLAENGELTRLLSKMKRTLRDRETPVRWVAPDLWHVTLHFLGEQPDGDERLRNLLASWAPKSSDLRLRLQGVGAFPEPEAARVLWVGVQASQEFLNLQVELGQRLREACFAFEEREFRPHLTLARFRNPISATDLIGLGGRKHFGDYPIGELVLFESFPQGNIIKYVPRFRQPLQ